MARFHPSHEDLGELHGITVLVETADGRMIVGRCHEANAQHALILDADIHEGPRDEQAGWQWLQRAARWGVFPTHRAVDIPSEEVNAITRLSDIPPEA